MYASKTINDDDSVFSDECSLSDNCSMKSNDSLNLADHMAFFKKSDAINNNRYYEKKISTCDTNGFASQFENLKFDNPYDPVSSNSTHYTNNLTQKLGIERDMALNGGYSNFSDSNMTYGIVTGNEFVHNNMVPFFKSGSKKGYGDNPYAEKQMDAVKQRKLDTFTGTKNNPEYRQKIEAGPLFEPHAGLTNIYGMQNCPDSMKSRFIASREKKNEYLHQPIQITPGLNLGYNEVSKQGFNDNYRPDIYTTNDLRTANNPKISYGNVIIPGLKGVNRPVLPNIAKRTPVKFKENDVKDLLRTSSYIKAPTLRGNFDVKPTNRQMKQSWVAPANSNPTYHKPEVLMEKYDPSNRENYEYDGPRNVTGVDQSKNITNTANSYEAPPTKRQIHENNNWINPAGAEWSKGNSFDHKNNVPNLTLRNVTENNTWIIQQEQNGQKGIHLILKIIYLILLLETLQKKT